jgi:hypothetical protein
VNSCLIKDMGYKKGIPICQPNSCCISWYKTTDVGQENNYCHLENTWLFLFFLP